MSKRTTEVDVPPVEEEDRTEVSIWDALHSRNQLREYLKNEGTYTNLRKKHLSSFLTEDGTIHTSFVVNYVIGEHFKRGATNWRDLEDEARVFRHCLLNGYAHLVGTKVTPKGKLPSCQTVLIQEALVMPEVHPGEHGPVIRYRINGWRESMNTTITSAALADYNKKRQSQFRGKTQPAKDTNPRPKKKQRKDEEISESDEEAETDEQDEVGRIPMVASDTYSPIALAMEQSFEEASRLDKKITNERNNARNKAQQKANAAIVAGRKAPPSVDIPSIVLQGYDVKSMCPYSYLNAKDKLEFHAVVSGYIRPRTYAVSEGEVTFGQIHDPRDFINFTTRDQDDRSLRFDYASRDHLLNPDSIFSKESAMTYFTYNRAGKRIVCRGQTNLKRYTKGVLVFGDDDEPIEHEVEAAEYGGANLDMALDMLNQDPDFPVPAPDKAFLGTLERDLDEDVPDTAFPHYKYPQLVNKISLTMVSSDAQALTNLLFPVGHLLSETEFQTGVPDMPNMLQLVAHTRALKVREDTLNDIHRIANPGAAPKGILFFIQEEAKRASHGNVVDTQDVLSELKLIVPVTDDVTKNKELDHQRSVVDAAMLREKQRIYGDKDYNALFGFPTPPEQSLHDYMSDGELLPLDFALKPTIKNMMKGVLENHLRARFFLLHAQTMDALPPGEREKEERRLAEEMKVLLEHLVNGEVDSIPSYFLETDDLLKLHVNNQILFNTQRHRVMNMEKTTDEGELIKRRNQYCILMNAMRIQAADEVIKTLRESTNIADVLKSMEFRAFFEKNCTDHSMRALGADHPRVPFDAKPFVLFIQHMVDIFAVTLGIREPALRIAMITKGTALDSQMWKIGRILPALNCGLIGPAGVGKSTIIQAQIQLVPPGVASNITQASAQAFNTSTNNDGVFLAQEEAKVSLVAPTKEDRERGVSNEHAMKKDRLTRFVSIMPRTHFDKETGKATTVTSINSCHMSELWAGNMHESHLDLAMKSRNMIYNQVALQGETGFKPDQMHPLDYFNNNRDTHKAILRERITFVMYMILRSFIKAEVLPMPDHTYSNMVIVEVLKELNVKYDARKLHFFVQFAENYQLYFTAHILCWSVFQALYHKEEDSAPRWSGRSIIDQAPPWMQSVSTDATIFSLTCLDFLVLSTQTHSVMCDIVKLLHISDGIRKCKFQQYIEKDLNNKNVIVFNANALVIVGNSDEDILKQIASINSIYELDAAAIKSVIDTQNAKMDESRSYIIPADAMDRGVPTRIELDKDNDAEKPYTPFFFEDNDIRRSGVKRRLVVNVHFLEKYFTKKISDTADWKNMQTDCIVVDEQTLQLPKDAHHLGYVSTDRSTMAAAIQKVLSNRTLLAYENEPRRGINEKCYEFITGQTQTPIQVKLNIPREDDPTKFQQYRTMFNGTLLMQKLERDPHVNPIFRVNYHRPSTSMVEEHSKFEDDSYRKSLIDNQKKLGFSSETLDAEYVFSKLALRNIAHPGCLTFLELLRPAEELAALLQQGSAVALPEPVPFGFGPLSYYLQKEVCKKLNIAIGKDVFPDQNIFDQLRGSMDTQVLLRSPADRQKMDKTKFLDVGTLLQKPFSGGVAFEGITPKAEPRFLPSFYGDDDAPTLDAMDIDEPRGIEQEDTQPALDRPEPDPIQRMLDEQFMQQRKKKKTKR